MNNFLETERISSLMCKYSIPCVISLLVGALYNIVDQIFIANASYLGSFGNAANTVVFPLTVIALAFAVMIGDGCCAFVSITLGKKDKDNDAPNSVGSAILLLFSVSLILMILYLAFSDAIVIAFGGNVNKETFALSKEYFFWITLGLPFYIFGQGINPIIRSDGSPSFAMLSTLSGAVVNIILDPIFIFALKWGMKGAAIATVIGQIVTAILSIIYLFNMKAIKLKLGNLRFYFKLMKKYIPLGFSSLFSQISLVLAMAVINNMVSKYSAIDPIFGKEEYRQIPMAVLGIVMKIFGSGNESSYYLEFALKAFRVYLCCIVLACINKASFIYLQALGKATISTLLSVTREVVFGVGFAILLPRLFGLDGVLYSMPLSDICTFVISTIAMIYTVRLLRKQMLIFDFCLFTKGCMCAII